MMQMEGYKKLVGSASKMNINNVLTKPECEEAVENGADFKRL